MEWREMDDYLVIKVVHENKMYVEVRSGYGEGRMPMSVGEKVAEIAEMDGVNDCIISKESILLSYYPEKLSDEQVEVLVNQIIALLKDNRIPGITTCPMCKKDLSESQNVHIKINNRLMKVHDECYKSFIQDVEAKKETIQGNYLTGVLGAVLFGAIGAIPWFIVGMMGWFVSLLGMVIGISANYGYNLFKGKQGRFKSITLVIVIIVMVFAAGFATQLYELYAYLGQEGIEGVSLIDGSRFIIELLQQDSQFAGSFTMNVVLGLVFGFLGSWRIIKASSTEPAINNLSVELVED